MKQYNFKINGNEYNVTINSVDGNVADVTVTASYKVELGNGTGTGICACTGSGTDSGGSSGSIRSRKACHFTAPWSNRRDFR